MNTAALPLPSRRTRQDGVRLSAPVDIRTGSSAAAARQARNARNICYVEAVSFAAPADLRLRPSLV